jgi:hypothetical protein
VHRALGEGIEDEDTDLAAANAGPAATASTATAADPEDLAEVVLAAAWTALVHVAPQLLAEVAAHVTREAGSRVAVAASAASTAESVPAVGVVGVVLEIEHRMGSYLDICGLRFESSARVRSTGASSRYIAIGCDVKRRATFAVYRLAA